jgi:hypothetical protein
VLPATIWDIEDKRMHAGCLRVYSIVDGCEPRQNSLDCSTLREGLALMQAREIGLPRWLSLKFNVAG